MILVPHPRKVPAHLLPHFVRLEQSHWGKVRAEHWITDILAGECWLWEVGAGEGIVLTTIQQVGDERELRIDGLAGTGIIRRASEIMGELRAIARQYNCTLIGGEAIPKGLRRVYDRLGMRAVAVRYIVEIGQ